MPPSAPKKYTNAFELPREELRAPSDIHLSFLQSTRTLHPSRRTVYVQTPGREEAAEALRETVGERSQQGASRVGATRCILDFAAKITEIEDFRPSTSSIALTRPIGERAWTVVVWTAGVGAANNGRREEALRPHERLPREASA
jgi:hypothetical protein